MVDPDKIILDKKTILFTRETGDKILWMVSVDNVGSCGSAVVFPEVVEAVRNLGKCSAEAIENLTNCFNKVKIPNGKQLELF